MQLADTLIPSTYANPLGITHAEYVTGEFKEKIKSAFVESEKAKMLDKLRLFLLDA